MELAGALNALKSGLRHDDDFTDRLNHRWTVGLFVMFAVIIVSKTYVGDPIQCWSPAQFTSNYVDYTNKVCWVSNTYFIPMADTIPRVSSLKPHLTYYQWTPFILLFQALLFYFPCMIWRSLNNRSGMYINNIITAAGVFAQAAKFDEREKMVKYITRHMDRYIELREKFQAKAHGKGASVKNAVSKCGCLVGRRFGNYLVTLYLTMKALFAINAIVQLFMLNAFLGQKFHLFGLDAIGAFLRAEDTTESPAFPRVTLCDFKIREVGNKAHEYTVQCVLQINLFNEKIFLFIWWWLALMAALALLSFIQWVWRLVFKVDRVHYIKRHLKVFNRLAGEGDKQMVREFVHKYLKEDGVFTLRLISKNTSDLVVAEITNSLWENYRDFRPHREEPEEMVEGLPEKKPLTA